MLPRQTSLNTDADTQACSLTAPVGRKHAQMSYSLISFKGDGYRGYIGIVEKKIETTIWGLGSKLLKGVT